MVCSRLKKSMFQDGRSCPLGQMLFINNKVCKMPIAFGIIDVMMTLMRSVLGCDVSKKPDRSGCSSIGSL